MKTIVPSYCLLFLLLVCCSLLFSVPFVYVQITGRVESFLAFYGVFCGALGGVLTERWLGVWRGFASHTMFVCLVLVLGLAALTVVIPVTYGLVPEASEANLEYLSSRSFGFNFIREQALALVGYSWNEHPLQLSADLFVAAFSCLYLSLGAVRHVQSKRYFSESLHEGAAARGDRYAQLAILLVFLNGALATVAGFEVLGDEALHECVLLALFKYSSILPSLMSAVAATVFISIWKRDYSSAELDSYVLSGYLFISFVCGCLVGVFAVCHFVEVDVLAGFAGILKLPSLIVSVVIALLSLCIGAVALWGNGQREQDVECVQGEIHSHLESSEIAECADACKLTGREAQVLQGMLDGASASESSEKLGISASTVRTYRQRVKSKLTENGFAYILKSDAIGTPNGIAEAVPCDESVVSSKQTESAQVAFLYISDIGKCSQATRAMAFFSSRANEVLQVMIPALMLLLLLPFGYGESFSSKMLWQNTATGLGAALLVFGLLVLVAAVKTDGGALGFESIHFNARLIAFLAVTAMLLALGFVYIRLNWLTLIADYDYQLFSVLTMICIALFGFTTALLAYARMLSIQIKRRKLPVVAILFVAVLIALIASINNYCWAVAFLITSALIAEAHLCVNCSDQEETSLETSCHKQSPAIARYLLLACFVASVAIFLLELWFEPDKYDLAVRVLYAVFCLTAGCMFILPSEIKNKKMLLFCAVLFVVYALMNGVLSLIYILAFLMCAGVLFRETSSLKEKGVAFVVFGISLLCGFGLIDQWNNAVGAIKNYESGMSWSSLDLLVAPTVLFTLHVMGAAALAAMLYLSTLRFQKNDDDDKRMTMLLRGLGIGETDAEIVALLIAGKPAAEVSKQLSFATGTVNAARYRVYSALNVHSIVELRRKLKRAVEDAHD